MIWIKSIFSCNRYFINSYSAHFGLKLLKKIPVILLYWFPAQQNTSTLRCQKQGFFDLKFSVEPNIFVPSFYREHKVAQNYSKNVMLGKT